MQSQKAGSADKPLRAMETSSTSGEASLPGVDPAHPAFRSGLKTLSWLLYDFANAWFSMVVLTAYYILYFKQVIVGGQKGYSDFLWGVTISSAMAVSVLLAPILGATADAKGRKKSFMAAFASLSIFSLFALYFTGPGQKAWAMFLVSAGYVGYTLAMTFYNSFLPEIAPAGAIEKLSGFAWGLGYIAGLAALVCMIFLVPNVAGGKAILLLAGAAYALFALPSFFFLKDSPRQGAKGKRAITEGFARLGATFREIRRLKNIFLFLIAYFFVADAIATVIVFFSSYTVDTLRFTVTQNVILLMLIQLSAAAGAIASGVVAKRIGLLKTIVITIVIWILALLGIVIFQSIYDFYALSVCAGSVLGGTQATARAYMAIEAPEGKKAEFFGFMTFSTKAAAIFGPLLYGTISDWTNNPRISVLSLEALFILGLFFMVVVLRREARSRA
ncbi:MAG: MFS transporter [Syntrophobacteraceae bacterium]|nr:MFS transporter [Syntrophobacteraceae bacterium]